MQGAITERLEPLVSTGDGGPEPVTSWQRIQDLIVVRSEGARILRFALTGGASTLIYAVATLGLAAGGLAASTASVIAYFAGAAFSYAGHRVFTFVSRGSIAFEMPRFFLTVAFGMGISTLLAFLLTDRFEMPTVIPVGICAVLIPVLNFIILRKWVFASQERADGRRDPAETAPQDTAEQE